MTSPIEHLASLRVGTVEYISPDKIEVQLDIDTPDNVALNTGYPRNFPRINGFVMIPIDLGFVVMILLSFRLFIQYGGSV